MISCIEVVKKYVITFYLTEHVCFESLNYIFKNGINIFQTHMKPAGMSCQLGTRVLNYFFLRLNGHS